MPESAADPKPRRELRKKYRPSPPAGKSPYASYAPVRSDVTVPLNPLFRYETNRVGYIAYKYILPMAAAITYIAFFLRHVSLDYYTLAYSLFSPAQLLCLAVLPTTLYLTAPLSHIIICEEGMFIRNGLRRVFVPWKYLRSYHPSRYLQPWVIIIGYYTARKRHRRVFAITSLATEHTMVEIMNFIRKVRQNPAADADPGGG